MKAFWDNLFFDLNNGELKSQEEMALKGGHNICDDLRRIEDAIRQHDGKKALEIIEELKNYY